MKTPKAPEFYQPFKHLKKMIQQKVGQTVSSCLDAPVIRDSPSQKVIDEKQLFLDAMVDVKPIRTEKHVKRQDEINIRSVPVDNHDAEMIDRLNRLIESGQGFVVADTPEYMEGESIAAHPEITKRLHRGDFSIQAHIDLHGLGVADAKHELDIFLKDAIRTGKKAVLIVHGRGLSSSQEPILKTKVYEWFTRGSWRKWVIAFTSARIHDGGAGATYVLLRRRPLTRRYRKRKTG